MLLRERSVAAIPAAVLHNGLDCAASSRIASSRVMPRRNSCVVEMLHSLADPRHLDKETVKVQSGRNASSPVSFSIGFMRSHSPLDSARDLT